MEEDKDLKEFYYHFCPILLEEGSVIRPGNYGRLVIKNSSAFYVREMFLEEIRIQFFTNKPSRFSSIFLFKTLHEAKQYMRTAYFVKNNYHDGILYKVEIINKIAPLHIGCTGILGLNNVGIPWPQVAQKYWLGQDIYFANEAGGLEVNPKEYVVASSVKILGIEIVD